MKFIINTIEYEKWERDYIIKAKNKKEAIKNLKTGCWQDCPFGECNKSRLVINDIRKVN